MFVDALQTNLGVNSCGFCFIHPRRIKHKHQIPPSVAAIQIGFFCLAIGKRKGAKYAKCLPYPRHGNSDHWYNISHLCTQRCNTKIWTAKLNKHIRVQWLQNVASYIYKYASAYIWGPQVSIGSCLFTSIFFQPPSPSVVFFYLKICLGV